MTSTFLATFQLTLPLHSVTYPSPSGHAAPQKFSRHCGVWAASILGWFHCSSGWAAPVCSLLGRVSHCFWHAPRCSDVEGSALPSPPQATQPKPGRAIQTFPVCCLHGSHLSPSPWIRLLREVCAFCRQRGGGGRGWQGRWRTRWYTEYIEQCIMYWVMQQPEN